MIKKMIKFYTIEEVENFVKITSNHNEAEIDVRCGKYIVDGKSYLGILALGICKNLVIEISNANDKFYDELKQFNVKDL